MDGALGGIEACVPGLQRYARTLVRDRHDALVHDCLLRAIERFHTRRENDDLRAWLFAILHELFVSQTRRSKPRIAPWRIAETKKNASSPDLPQDLHLDAAELVRAVESLPEPQRSVLVLVTLEDLSYAQVANPLGTVMSRLAQARERLAAATDPVALPPVLRRVK